MKKKSSFKCTQQELYLIVPLAWGLCRKNLSRFAKYFGVYTEGYVADRIAEVAVAKAIPNYYSRKDEPSSKRVLLDAAIADCCHFFLFLEAMIAETYRAEMLEMKYQAVGTAYYGKAEQGNEGALNDLNDSAIKFMTANEADLKADNKMTDAFMVDYQAAVANYEACRMAYNDSSETATSLTQDNSEANEKIFKKMMGMFAHAQIVFKKEPEMRAQFTFTNVLNQVVSAGVAGIRGKVTELGTKKGINKVKIGIEGKEKTYETDKLGKYDIAQLANGTYTVIFSCEGYNDVVFDDFEVKTGVYNTLNVGMEAVEVGELVAA